MKVFCYGTLKREHRNNYLLDSATFIGTGQTVAKCRLLDAGFPVLRPRTHRATNEANAPVRGEVYEVDEQTLQRLDRLESEGHMYNRRRMMIKMDDGGYIKACVYVGNAKFWQYRKQPYPVPSGAYDWPIYRKAAAE